MPARRQGDVERRPGVRIYDGGSPRPIRLPGEERAQTLSTDRVDPEVVRLGLHPQEAADQACSDTTKAPGGTWAAAASARAINSHATASIMAER
ncbi:MAG: hypothetical protein M5U01_10060 [Ardenticatenaceae bacterium]|nr:hypothetical protein [Ardenticatenaceae bacterium]